MVIVNPRLSLPTDLPYKRRQRQFFPGSPLQQATIRYNEAIRKKYNDIQFAKCLENGSSMQNETVGVNTIDISKLVDPTLFPEMNSMNSFSALKKCKPKRFDCSSSPGPAGSTDVSQICKNRQSGSVDNARLSNTSTSATASEESVPENSNNGGYSTYHSNDSAMFPHLQTNANTDSKKPNNTAYFAANMKPPLSTSSLEAQAMNEYEPTIDSAHDMIFGNVMGMDYGNYIHGPLWTSHQQGSGNSSNNGSSEPSPNFHTPSSSCGSNKLTPGSGGFIQTHTSNPSAATSPFLYDINGGNGMKNKNVCSAMMNPLPIMGKHGGPGRRSTSVPRPRVGTQKETLKQAAIRCGIIKGNHTVATIQKRSHGLVPLELTQSDPIVSVVEIFHPKETLPTCSSEALVEFEDFKFKTTPANSNISDAFAVHNNKSTSALSTVVNADGDVANHNDLRMETGKCNSEGHSHVATEAVSAGSSGRAIENAISCPTL